MAAFMIGRQVDPERRDETDQQSDYRYDEKYEADDAQHRHQLAHDDDDDDDNVRTILSAVAACASVGEQTVNNNTQ